MGPEVVSKKDSLERFSSRNDSEKVSPELLRQVAGFLYGHDNLTTTEFGRLMDSFADKPLENLDKDLNLFKEIVGNLSTPVSGLIERLGCTVTDVLKMQRWIQTSRLCKETLNSSFYPGYLSVGYATSFYNDLVKNPDYLQNIRDNKPVAPRKLEIHATNASCNYRCDMCLWHVKGKAHYDSSEKNLLTKDDWINVLKDAKELGTETIIFSGGGEPLLRPDIAEILEYAERVGLLSMIYTNGSELHKLNYDSRLYQALLHTDWLRVSLHATTDTRYARLVGLPEKSKAFSRVVEGLVRLTEDRNKLNLPLKIGMGFVIQALNHDQINDVVALAYTLGLDFLNLRMDCINITEELSEKDRKVLYSELCKIRSNLYMGKYGTVNIDFDDRLIASINEWGNLVDNNILDCRVYLYRPAINPFGRVGICDLAAEPYFSRDELTMGYVGPQSSFKSIVYKSFNRKYDASQCSSCMPGQKIINALWNKVIEDSKLGIWPEDQALFFK